MSPATDTVTRIPVDSVELDGELIVPEGAGGLVVFAHGSASSRHSPRNNFVAEALRERGLGTLLFDLLTEAEDRDRSARFDISLLTDRLVGVTDRLRDWPDTVGCKTVPGIAGPVVDIPVKSYNRPYETADLAIGYFGSSTGAAAALRAEARRPGDIDAVVSRGGRVDLASNVLADIRAPTLLVVGGEDDDVLALNREAYGQLDCETDLHVVSGAGHLFEGPGELEEVADVAGQWFATHLA